VISTAGVSAGIVLAGGRSTRMGTAKADLEWHGDTLLGHAAGLLERAVSGPVVVVRAPGRDLPALPASVTVVADPVEGRGPVQGLATGLAAVADRAPVAFVCATDLPFLHPAYVRRVLDLLAAGIDAGVDAVLPHVRGHVQPLATAYRTALAPVAAELVAGGRLRLAGLFDRCQVRRVDDADLLADPRLAAVDPALDSLLNVNEPADYRLARQRPAPEITVLRAGAPAVVVRAASVAAAASAVGLDGSACRPELNGAGTSPHTPLVAGDTVAFRPAQD
jgi:molybdenum cofactor guanylyltransferase